MVDFFFSTTKVRNPPGILRIILTICLLLADFVRNDAANLMLPKCQPPADALAERGDALAERGDALAERAATVEGAATGVAA